MPERKTPDQKLAELQAKRDRLNARIQKEQAKARTEARKEDTRRKIVAGAIALEHCEHDPNFRHVFHDLLRKHVKESDQALFDLTTSE